jgi:DNA-binding protein HU-beta
MNKADLINDVAKIVSTKKEAQKVVDCILSTIQDALVNKEMVQIAGFGSFKVVKREARKGRHPQTGEEIDIKARMVTKFVSGKALKDAVK